MPNGIKRFIPAALLSLVFLANPPLTQAQTDGKGLKLSLSEGALKLIENNLDIIIEKIGPEVASVKAEGAQGAFDPEASASFRREDAKEPLSSRGSVTLGGRRATESESYSLDAGVSGKTGIGTQYSVEASEGWTADTFNNFDFEYTSFAGVRVTQPLLKGLGADSNRLNVNITKKDRDISLHRFKKRLIDTLSEYELAYWGLVRARGEFRVKEESLRLAGTLLEDNRKRLNLGVISELDVTQAEAAVAARMDELIAAKKAVRENEKTVKLLISKDAMEVKDLEIIPVDEPSLVKLEADVEEGFGYAVKNRPDYLELKSEIEKHDLRVRYSFDQRLPMVDLEASWGLNGIGPSLGSPWGGMDSNPEWSVGMTFRYPLGNRAALSELKASRLEASRALLRLKQLEQEMLLNIDNAIKEMKAETERIESTRTSTRLSLLALRAEEKKLAAGRSTTYNVLKLQEDLIKAKTNEISALIDYNRAVIVYLKEKGEILERRGINVTDGGMALQGGVRR